ncbi:hypothetical protein MTR67_034736 [Solanum verrucosum]|uniref:Uncharacterized protein n=1 Tax=Solanum verrucosum TaxID=315347 RepID=A0AAF0U923_SOLVR|nr:hypothetical protein MTR67_034736 [Solanum verrucosum]
MSFGGEGDISREHLGVSQPNKTKKKKSRRPIDFEDIPGFLSSTPKRITHDTHLLVVPFGTADLQPYYPNYRRPVSVSFTSQSLPPRRYKDLPLHVIRQARPLSTSRLSAGRTPSPSPSPTSTSPQLSTMRIRDSSSVHLDVVAGTPPLTQHYVHPGVSPTPTLTPTPSSTPTPDETSALAAGQRDIIGRVMIESSWYPSKDVARALKYSVRRFFTQTYHSRSEILNSIRQTMFNEFKKKEMGLTPLVPEVFKKTHVKRKENESDLDVWVEERAEQTFIEKLIAALQESERKRVVEQESMSTTIKQIKKQVLNLAHRPTSASSPIEGTDDDREDDDDYIDCTP